MHLLFLLIGKQFLFSTFDIYALIIVSNVEHYISYGGCGPIDALIIVLYGL